MPSGCCTYASFHSCVLQLPAYVFALGYGWWSFQFIVTHVPCGIAKLKHVWVMTFTQNVILWNMTFQAITWKCRGKNYKMCVLCAVIGVSIRKIQGFALLIEML